ncbi:NAD(P)/FAD-dependent oxidoreductase [Streptomyces sp. SD31]|uniref:NAD(P)/FAD-dependent oxidoreductase n=1 Tax=Streptomyces sp. SD31 TaxID=3452208 RepID=UPI003F8B4E24
MSTTCETDVTILGAGSAGLFLAHYLLSEGARCALIGENPNAGYASTRNQGWLQSGAFYAAVKRPLTAEACWEGYGKILDSYPGAVQTAVDGYALFRTETALAKAMGRCSEVGITLEDLPDTEAHRVQAEIPLLQGSPFQSIALTADHPVDTHELLTSLSSDVAKAGAHCFECSHMDAVSCTYHNDSWSTAIEKKSVAISSQALVLACGAYIPRALRRFAPELRTHPPLLKATILVLHSSESMLSSSILMIPGVAHAPTVVPFYDSEGQQAGVNIFATSTVIDDVSDTGLPSDTTDVHATRLQRFFPGLLDIVSSHLIKAHFYTCQIPQDTRRLEWYIDECRLALLYPGKFTASPVAAEKCAQHILKDCRLPRPAYSSLDTTAVGNPCFSTAKQLYFSEPKYALEKDINSGLLIFEE